MAFPYQFVLSPWAQEQVYVEMVQAGDQSAQETVTRLLVEGAEQEEVVEAALRLARKMVMEKRG